MPEKEETILLRASKSIAKEASDFAMKNKIPLREYTDEALKILNERYKYSQEALLQLVESQGTLRLRRDYFERAFKDSKEHIRKHFIDFLESGSIAAMHEFSLVELEKDLENLKKENTNCFLVIIRANPQYKVDGNMEKLNKILDQIDGKDGNCYEMIIDQNITEEFKVFIMLINEKKEDK